MQLFSIRGSAALLAAVIVFAVAYAAGLPGWAAFLVAIFVGPTISWALLARGPLASAADRTDRWLETPKFPKR